MKPYFNVTRTKSRYLNDKKISWDMLIQQHSIGHSQFIWDVRQNEKIADVFAKIWKCNKLGGWNKRVGRKFWKIQ